MRLDRHKLRKMILKEIYNLREETGASSIGKTAGGGKAGDSKVRKEVYMAFLSLASGPAQLTAAPTILGMAAAYTASPDFRIYLHGKLDDAGVAQNAVKEKISKAIDGMMDDLKEYYDQQKEDFADLF